MKSSKNTLMAPGMNIGFLSDLKLYCLTREDAKRLKGNDDVPYFQLLEPFRYQSDILDGVIEIPIEPIFITDLGSIPRVVWSWLSPDD